MSNDIELDFNLVEVTKLNTFQLRFIRKHSSIRKFVRTAVDATQDLTNYPAVVRELGSALKPVQLDYYRESLPIGESVDAPFIRILAETQSFLRYDPRRVLKYQDDNGVWRYDSEKLPAVVVDCLEDLSQHPDKVRTVGSILFTDKVKAAYIASLPRVGERQATVERPVMIDNPRYNPEDPKSKPKVQALELKTVHHKPEVGLDGVLRPAVSRKESVPQTYPQRVFNPDGSKVMVQCPVDEAERIYIAYKGNLYPEDWAGDLSDIVISHDVWPSGHL